ncbi:hypothetical protein I4U23_022326 [Adineta vaga]|nr:hypothetical protein I4U23_022326 [Adineta vaga]
MVKDTQADKIDKKTQFVRKKKFLYWFFPTKRIFTVLKNTLLCAYKRCYCLFSVGKKKHRLYGYKSVFFNTIL